MAHSRLDTHCASHVKIYTIRASKISPVKVGRMSTCFDNGHTSTLHFSKTRIANNTAQKTTPKHHGRGKKTPTGYSILHGILDRNLSQLHGVTPVVSTLPPYLHQQTRQFYLAIWHEYPAVLVQRRVSSVQSQCHNPAGFFSFYSVFSTLPQHHVVQKRNMDRVTWEHPTGMPTSIIKVTPKA